MAEQAKDTRDKDKDPSPAGALKGASRELTVALPGAGDARCEATADWMILRKDDKPVAEMFHVHYRMASGRRADRPVTFVFNGGPGAASAYLHVGALGPRRVHFNADGSLPKPPARLVDNLETWLAFTDLVFIDPIGTGFSRTIAAPAADAAPSTDAKAAAPAAPKEADHEFFTMSRDLESLGEFISRFLSKHQLWTNPVFIAGESYGGFRAAKLTRLLQQGYGVGLSGAMLISPAMELHLLDGGDYDALHWLELFPSMALSALHHGRSRGFAAGTTAEGAREQAEAFATGPLASLLIRGRGLSDAEYTSICHQAAALIGLPEAFVRERGGRVTREAFVRELLREQRVVCGLYDASMLAIDPFSDRDSFHGADPTLFAVERAFTAGINAHLRTTLGLETDRDYRLLSFEVNNTWKLDGRKHAFELQVGATDDLRYGMALNPHMRVMITHGYYDLVTPYFASARLAQLMRLQPSQRERLVMTSYLGGHMYYAWEASRRAFRADVGAFYAASV